MSDPDEFELKTPLRQARNPKLDDIDFTEQQGYQRHLKSISELRKLWEGQLPDSFIDHVQELGLELHKLFDLVTAIKSNNLEEELAQDVSDLLSGIIGIKNALGVNELSLYPDVWSAIQELDSNIQGISSTPNAQRHQFRHPQYKSRHPKYSDAQ